MDNELLTSHQVANLAGVSVSYVQILRRNGTISAASAERNTGGGGNSIVYRFDPDVVQVCRASKAQARERQRSGGSSKLTMHGRRLCTRRPMKDGSPRPCATYDLDCQVCLVYYNSTQGISGSGTGSTELVGAGR